MSGKTYPSRVTRAALGIRAQALRTLVRKAWWARRWIAAVEAFRLGPRLGRGRQYAIAGQVVDLRFEGPHVVAAVLGSRPKPYVVTLDFTTPSDEALARIAARLKARPELLARVLVDDLPTEVETFFADEGCPLFPVPGVKPPYDVVMSCSCPDWCKPCKHVAAVLFLLGEEIARRPSSLLAIRGLDVDQLFPETDGGDPTLQPLPQEMLLAHSAVTAAEADPTALLSRLGSVPFWRGVNRCQDSLTRIYTRVHAAAAPAAEGNSLSL